MLKIEHSLGGQQWHLNQADSRNALALAQRYNVPELIGQILDIRGFTLHNAANFLEPKLRDLMPDPFHLKDMDKAVDRLSAAIKNNESIVVFGDYDVDGATSTALLKRYFSMLGVDIGFYIPDRMKEGYGPNANAMRFLKQQGADVVITVDCGIVAYEALQAAKDVNLDVIVIDHHVGEPELPPAVAVVNPNRFDENSELGHLAAVGVCFVVAAALNKHLEQQGYFNSRPKPDLRMLLDIVALGTVCDVVPLKTLNRAFVVQGLKIMAHRRNVGLKVLADVAKAYETPNAYQLGFLFGPRINAGGRIGESDLGTKLLTCDDTFIAQEIALKLDGYNKQRQEIEQVVLDDAMQQVERSVASSIAIASGHANDGWHAGVIGIVAGRLKDRFHRPACTIAIDEQGMAKGSGRSVSGIHLGNLVIAARQAGIITAGGGHGMAAGFSLPAVNINDFQAFLAEKVSNLVEEQDLKPVLRLDGCIKPQNINIHLAQTLERLAPFGAGNPQPRFMIENAVITWSEIVGNGHVRCQLHNGREKGYLKAMAFRCADTEVGQALLGARNKPVHLAGTIKVDTWGREPSAQVMIEDVSL